MFINPACFFIGDKAAPKPEQGGIHTKTDKHLCGVVEHFL